MSKDLPPPELLRKLLRYEPDTGNMFWYRRSVDLFTDGAQSAEHNCNIWNSKHADREAFTSSDNHGYKIGKILGGRFRAHRVIWALVYGEWPEEQIDHANHIRDDNRIENLRVVSHAENGRNQTIRKDNTSGVTGVFWCKNNRRWVAAINAEGKAINLGRFNCITAAAVARKQAEIKYCFHPNHGK